MSTLEAEQTQANGLYAPDAIERLTSKTQVAYPDALAFMEERAAAIYHGRAKECLWFLEHPPLYTAGTSAKPADLKDQGRFPVYQAGRGGEYTYHGPGQRVVYVMLDLRKRKRDVRAFVNGLEDWIIGTLADFGVHGERRSGRVGVWVDRTEPNGPLREDKIAAIGVRLRRWVSFHGISFNVAPDLNHFNGITPCGIAAPGLGVTSLADLGLAAQMDAVDTALEHNFSKIFGPTR